MIIIVALVITAALAAGGYMWYRRRECPQLPVARDPSKENIFFERFLPKPISGQSGELL